MKCVRMVSPITPERRRCFFVMSYTGSSTPTTMAARCAVGMTPWGGGGTAQEKMTMWVSQSGLNNKGAVTKNKSGKVWLERVRSNSLKDSQDSYSLSTAPWCPPSGRCWWSWTSCCPAADCPALASWSEAATEQQSHCQKWLVSSNPNVQNAALCAATGRRERDYFNIWRIRLQLFSNRSYHQSQRFRGNPFKI